VQANAPLSGNGVVSLHRLLINRYIVHVQQLFFIKDHLLTGRAYHVILGGQLDRIDRAGLLAHAAKDATQFIDLKLGGVLFAIVPRRLCRFNVNALGGADCGAHHAGHTLHSAGFIAVKPMHASKVGGMQAAIFHLHVLAAFFGILHRPAGFALAERGEKVTQRGPEPLNNVWEVDGLNRRHWLGVDVDQVFVADRHSLHKRSIGHSGLQGLNSGPMFPAISAVSIFPGFNLALFAATAAQGVSTVVAEKLTLFQAVVLGLVEGITEYLPISSTGHLILASALMGLGRTPVDQEAIDTFNIVIQGGAIAAVIGLYWPTLLRMARGVAGRDQQGLSLLINLFIAFLPSAVLGLLLKDQIEYFLFRPVPVLIALGLGGIYMMVADLRAQGRLGKLPPTATVHVMNLTPGQALFIGVMQCVALWPGTSRSMMTITGGIWCGMKPRQAAEFSFLLGLPTLLAATLYKLLKNLSNSHRTGSPNMFETLGFTSCLVGIVVAAVSAAVAVKWLVGFLNKHGLMPFAWYRLVLCFVMAGLVMSGKVKVEPREKVNSVNQETRTVGSILWEDRPAAE